jgi:hypothetical protein
MKCLACPAAAVLTGLLMVGRAAAQEDAYPLGKDDPCHTHERAGYPLEVSKCASPSNGPRYFGYYIGGGCGRFGIGCCGRLCKGGRPPAPDEGTWGWDYGGLPHTHPFLVLGWGAPYQGGYGSYNTDKGPEVPDPIAYRLPEHAAKIERCGEGTLCVDTTKQKEPPHHFEPKKP